MKQHRNHRIRTLPETLKTRILAGVCLLVAASAAEAAAPTPAASAIPERIVSINLCADQLLLLLADPAQISALTHLSRERGASYFYQQALAYPTTKGLAEEVLPYKPDLVIAGEYGGIHTVSLLQKLGVRVETLPMANDFDTIFSNLEKVARWVGHPERGIDLAAKMRARLQTFTPATEQAPIAAVYDPNGYTVGAGSLRGQAMKLAGWQNAGELLGITGYGTLSLEAIVRLQPDALIDSPYTENTYSRAEALSRHPALRGQKKHARFINIPSSMTICDGPWLVDVIEQLQRERLALPAVSAKEKN